MVKQEAIEVKADVENLKLSFGGGGMMQGSSESLSTPKAPIIQIQEIVANIKENAGANQVRLKNNIMSQSHNANLNGKKLVTNQRVLNSLHKTREVLLEGNTDRD